MWENKINNSSNKKNYSTPKLTHWYQLIQYFVHYNAYKYVYMYVHHYV